MKEYDEVRGLRYNSDKLRYDLIPPLANREYAKVWTQALGKYPEGNWEKGMPWTEVIASAMRHLEAIRLEGRGLVSRGRGRGSIAPPRGVPARPLPHPFCTHLRTYETQRT